VGKQQNNKEIKAERTTKAMSGSKFKIWT